MSFKTKNFVYTLCLLCALGAGTKVHGEEEIPNAVEPVSTGETSFFSSMLYSLSVGPAWGKGGDTQTFFSDAVIERSYVADPKNDVFPEAKIFVGKQHDFNPSLKSWLGLEFGMTGKASLSGSIWEDADPAFDNFTSNYLIQHFQLAASGKFLFSTDFYALLPYVSVSIGLGLNRAHDYTMTPKVDGAVAGDPFASNSKFTLSYSVGLGVQRAINENWLWGVGYEFSDWGKSQLNAAPGQTLGSGLSIDHFYNHAVLVNLTYQN